MAETNTQDADAGLRVVQDFLGEVDEFEDPRVVVEGIVFCEEKERKRVSYGFSMTSELQI